MGGSGRGRFLLGSTARLGHEPQTVGEATPLILSFSVQGSIPHCLVSNLGSELGMKNNNSNTDFFSHLLSIL